MMWGAPDMLRLLWLMAPLTLVVAGGFWYRRARLRRIAEPAMLPVLLRGRQSRCLLLGHGLWLVALGCMFVAMARPQWGEPEKGLKQYGVEILFVLDTSRSMLSRDVEPNRLTQARQSILQLVRMLKGDRVGLVTFAGAGFLASPLTSDYSAFAMMLADARVGMVCPGGSRPDEGVRVAANAFESDAVSDRVIVLVSDGDDHGEGLSAIVHPAKARGIVLHAIGIGTPEGGLIPVVDEEGAAGYLADTEGRTVKAVLNEPFLRRLAQRGDGVYVRFEPGGSGLAWLYERGIRRLRRGEVGHWKDVVYRDRFEWFLGAAVVLLAAEVACVGMDCRSGPVPE